MLRLSALIRSVFAAAALVASIPLVAQPTLTWIPGSSVKLEQVTADCDWVVLAATKTCKPTASQTITRFNIGGQDVGITFEDQGKMLFFFGDTISGSTTPVDYHAHDAFAWSTTASGEDPLFLTYFTNSDGTPMFVQPLNPDGSKVPMGPDDIPSSGINLGGQVYVVVNTGADTSLAVPHQNAYSVLTRFDETAKTFTAGRTISSTPAGGHFVFTALCELPPQFILPQLGPGVVMFGMGSFRASDMFLAYIPTGAFWSGAGTVYYTGLKNGQPVWSSSESAAVPIVVDELLGGPAWPNDSPTIGNVSAAYFADLNLWMMTFDGGRNQPSTNGIYFSYAPAPWGPWATPRLIFNAARDHGDGVFIYAPGLNTPGPAGPTIGGNDPTTTHGATYAPQLIGRFTKVTGNTLDIYYNISTWNPYAIVKMRSSFTITPIRRRAAKQ